MKLLIIFSLSLLLLSCTNKETNSTISIPSNPMPVGELTRSALVNQYPKFNSAMTRVDISSELMEQLRSISKPTKITLVFGTWCHDSKREVPRLFALLDKVNNPYFSLKLVTVKYDKKIPDDYDSRFAIRYTPTIFISQDNRVKGMIIERPKVSLAEDLVEILERE